jgi:hypothetical protein
MANEPITEDYLGVLIQWAFLFGIIAVWLVPAFLFKDLAKRYNKSAWLFFFVGLAVGFVCFQISALVIKVASDLLQAETTSKDSGSFILSSMIFVIALLLIWGSVVVLKQILRRGDR